MPNHRWGGHRTPTPIHRPTPAMIVDMFIDMCRSVRIEWGVQPKIRGFFVLYLSTSSAYEYVSSQEIDPLNGIITTVRESGLQPYQLAPASRLCSTVQLEQHILHVRSFAGVHQPATFNDLPQSPSKTKALCSLRFLWSITSHDRIHHRTYVGNVPIRNGPTKNLVA